MRSVYESKKDEFWRNEIAENKGNTKKLWSMLNGLLARRPVTTPVFILLTNLLHSSATKWLQSGRPLLRRRCTTSRTELHQRSALSSWTTVTVDEVEKLIGSSLNKTCQLDPVPTWLVKDMSGILAPFVALLFNRSLVTGCFPSDFKRAVVRPLLKKSRLDASDRNNYRPVSNLSFLSKLLERVVQSRLQEFLERNGLMPSTQSAYRQFHSTETNVMKIYNDLQQTVGS